MDAMKHLRRPFWSLTATALLAWGLLAPAAARTSITGQTYSNTDYGFQVTAPAGWSVEKNVGAALVLLQSPDGRVGFRVYVDVMDSLDTPTDHRKLARNSYGIRGAETSVQALIEAWEGREPELLPRPVEYSAEPLVGELDDEALPEEGVDPEASPETSPESEQPTPTPETVAEEPADDDPDAGEVIIEDMTVMEGLIALQQTTGVPYKTPEVRAAEAESAEDQEELDEMAELLRELASGEPYLAVYDDGVTDPVSGTTVTTRHVVCYLLRNSVGYTMQASLPADEFHAHLRELISIFNSLRIPTLDGGRYGRSDTIEMDPQTTGVVVGRVLIRGTAVPGATVAVYRTREEYEESRPYKTTTSNYIGEFQLVGVAPGTYYLLEARALLGEEDPTELRTLQPMTNLKVRRGFASFVNLELYQVE
jgi:hypothetical protein